MHFGASAVGADGRRRAADDAAAYLPGAATKQMPPRPCGPQQSVSVISLQTLTVGCKIVCLTNGLGNAKTGRTVEYPADT